MMQKNTTLHLDPLFVAMTRPATKFGIPYVAFIIEFMGTAIIFIGTGNFLFLLTAAPIHVVLYMIAAKDPGAFDSLFMWLKTIASSSPTWKFWGAASFSPFIKNDPAKKWHD